jgi:hypothetical protein
MSMCRSRRNWNSFLQLCLEVEMVIIQDICSLHGANDDDDDDDAYDAICKTER